MAHKLKSIAPASLRRIVGGANPPNPTTATFNLQQIQQTLNRVNETVTN